MSEEFLVALNENGKIDDFLSDTELFATPEEFVRQTYLRILHYEYGYPKNVMAREVPIHYGSKVLRDSDNNPVRADIVVYKDRTACTNRDEGQMLFVVECKAPTETKGYSQLVSYIFNTNASGGVWFNNSGGEDQIKYFRRFFEPENKLIPWIGIPRFGEPWDAIDRRKKDELLRPKDIKGLLRRCHNKLHGRGNEGEEEDLTMDMVRIFLAKAQDEEKPGDYPEFYCTPEQYNSDDGKAEVAQKVQELFAGAKRLNPQVFSDHERITVGDRAICDVVIELQDYKLLTDFNDSQDWDLMGHAYEEYADVYLKRTRGQFFTNRLVVDFIIKSIDPKYDDIILDPAGGSGGFLTSVMRYVRNKILTGTGSTISKQRQLDRIRTRLFMIEVSKRLVKVAKTAMILNGDGHAGMTQGDSLGEYSSFDSTILASCGKNVPTVIVTNPPFAGVGEGRITQKELLQRYQTGYKWKKGDDNDIYLSDEIQTEGTPPELLFFERCLDWLSPGGYLGIVMPKSFLDTDTYWPGRKILFSSCQLLSIVNCHKNTFQPHTGVRTCLLILRKYKQDEEPIDEYDIFMAISNKIGQDSEGGPIYKRDKDNNLTDEIDHDLNNIYSDFINYKEGKLHESEYHFVVSTSSIGNKLNINPQRYLPSLNETLKKVSQIDEREGWSTVTIGQISNNVRVFKGPRFKSENLIVETISNKTTEPYYTPTAVLQEKSESSKLMDISLATEKQLTVIKNIRVKQGDIVITRSGSIGRVAYIPSWYDNAIVSDDLIRVRIPDEDMRYYVYYYLQSKFAQDQMFRNEYGAVQQHLEPSHISNIIIPIPDDPNEIESIIKNVKTALELKEKQYKTANKAQDYMQNKIEGLFGIDEEE